MNRVIQGLWIGSRLSLMEQMSMSSFLMSGHEYHLYVYDDVQCIPEGVVVKDAAEILPSSMIFQYKDYKTYAGFANLFRYKLLLGRGGWWADTDMVCLKPFDFDDEYIFATEISHDNEIFTNGIMKAPAGCEILEYVCQICLSKSPEDLAWGETGPKLLDKAVRKYSLERYGKPYKTFCPIHHWDWDKASDPDQHWVFDEATYAIHLWNEKWRRAAQDKDRSYHPDCLYEQLKKKFIKQTGCY